MRVEPVDSALDWRGIVEFAPVEPGWWQPWRLHSREVSAAAGNLADRARDASGVRLRVGEGVSALQLAVRGHPEAPLDITVGDRLLDRIRLDGERIITVPAGSDLWLPQFGHIQVGGVEFEGDPSGPPITTRWTTYGSSVTQCRGADGPSETWPALVARANQWDVTALGFGGECHLDPVAATTIRDRPADVISLCLGINIHGHATFSARTLVPAIIGFVDRVRERRECPILIIGPIASPPNERRTNDVGLTLEQVRDLVETAAVEAGEPYLDGRDLISEQDEYMLADGIHPTADGYRQIAHRIRPALARSAELH